MKALILHFAAGLFAGSVFGVQTLVVLALAVLLEGVAPFVLHGVLAGLAWVAAAQVALQVGYLAGIYLRYILERVGIIVAQPSR